MVLCAARESGSYSSGEKITQRRGERGDTRRKANEKDEQKRRGRAGIWRFGGRVVEVWPGLCQRRKGLASTEGIVFEADGGHSRTI